jgi:hypothetical protein
VKRRLLAFVAVFSLFSIFVFAALAQAQMPNQKQADPASNIGSIDPLFLPADPSFARSHDCKNVDYRLQLGAYRNQGETALCFAYTSAELVQHRTGLSVSALDLATTFYFANVGLLRSQHSPLLQEYLASHADFENTLFGERMGPDVDVAPIGSDSGETHPMFHQLEGGFEVPTLVLANLKGLCSEQNLPSAGGLKSHMDFILSHEKAALEGTGAVGQEVSEIIDRFRDPVADIFNTAWLQYVEAKCKRVVSKTPIIPVSYSMASDIRDFYNKVAAHKITKENKARLVAVLDFALNHARIAAIGYDLSTILDPNSEEVQKWTNPSDPGDGDHSSLVVARRKINGHCQYLIRDPSGFDCQDYLPKYAKRCEQHHIWLEEDELLESFYDIVYLR